MYANHVCRCIRDEAASELMSSVVVAHIPHPDSSELLPNRTPHPDTGPVVAFSSLPLEIDSSPQKLIFLVTAWRKVSQLGNGYTNNTVMQHEYSRLIYRCMLQYFRIPVKIAIKIEPKAKQPYSAGEWERRKGVAEFILRMNLRRLKGKTYNTTFEACEHVFGQKTWN